MRLCVSACTSAFRLHPAGVALVIGQHEQGPVGVTVSSLASVSASPPLVSFSLDTAGASASVLLSVGELRSFSTVPTNGR